MTVHIARVIITEALVINSAKCQKNSTSEKKKASEHISPKVLTKICQERGGFKVKILDFEAPLKSQSSKSGGSTLLLVALELAVQIFLIFSKHILNKTNLPRLSIIKKLEVKFKFKFVLTFYLNFLILICLLA